MYKLFTMELHEERAAGDTDPRHRTRQESVADAGRSVNKQGVIQSLLTYLCLRR